MIYVILADGFEEIEALTPVDMLRRAGKEVTAVGLGGLQVRGARGISVLADMTDSDYSDDAPEAIILPGGMPGARNLDASPFVDRLLEIALKSDAYICAICAAPMILGHRGLLKGKRATCYPGFETELEGANVVSNVRTERVVTDGHFITAAGMGAALDFSLAIISAFSGNAAADSLKKSVIG